MEETFSDWPVGFGVGGEWWITHSFHEWQSCLFETSLLLQDDPSAFPSCICDDRFEGKISAFYD